MSRLSSMPSRSLLRSAAFAVAALALFVATPSRADDAAYEAAIKDIEQTLGGVPTFVKKLPKAALPGAWMEIKAMEFSGPTALDPKTKSLISLAVAAQIPCDYCIWMDTNGAKQAGATDEQIAEAVAVGALTRHWSTLFYGLQVDLAQFKQELGGTH
jgi:AhpD family alkylhydroperoxidase